MTKITFEKLKILNALVSGPKTHKALRLAYYGEERCKSSANTSFYNQLGRMMEAGLIKKDFIGVYSLTELGEQAKDALPCGHISHEEGGSADYGQGCIDKNP